MGTTFYFYNQYSPCCNTYTKMATISSRSALGAITKLQNIPKKVALADIGAKVVTRQTTKKLHLDAALVDNGGASSDRSFPIGVADIDEKDLENPQLCAEYTQDVYAYLRKLEPSSTVRAGHLLGCSINDKMRAVLVDWLVEVQVQFKLLQETLFSTIDQEASMDNVWTLTLAYYSGYTMDAILPLVRRLAAIIVKTHKPSAKFQAVRTKYKGSKFLRVADLGELKSEVLQNIAL